MITAVTVTTTGSAGVATGSATSQRLKGTLNAIRVVYNGSAPATTDLTITETNAMGRAILTLVNTNTSAVYYPEVQSSGLTGSAISAEYKEIYIDSEVTIAVAQSDALAPAVTVIFAIED